MILAKIIDKSLYQFIDLQIYWMLDVQMCILYSYNEKQGLIFENVSFNPLSSYIYWKTRDQVNSNDMG